MSADADIQRLENRARLAIQAGVSALTAKGHVEYAINHAKHARIDGTLRKDLDKALELLDRVVVGAEHSRRRIARKIERKEHANG